jgi:hypothetical protein
LVLTILLLNPFLELGDKVVALLLSTALLYHDEVVGDEFQKLEPKLPLVSSTGLNFLELVTLQHTHQPEIFVGFLTDDILVLAIGGY